MNTAQFTQNQTCLDEIAKLHALCGTEYMDTIQEMFTDEQYDLANAHKAIDCLRV